MAKLTDNQREHYLKMRGLACPFCGSTDIVGEEITVDEGKAYQTISCADCEQVWTDGYTLTEVLYHDEPKDDPYQLADTAWFKKVTGGEL